jgi:hypothetical protein
MLVLKGCIKKSKVFTDGSVMKLKAKPSHTDTEALQKSMNYEVFHGTRKKDKKDGVRLKL